MSAVEVVDLFDARLARGTGGVLGAFNDAGILSTSDVHVALRLARLSGADDDVVSLGAAFAARAPRLGNVCVDLATVHEVRRRLIDSLACALGAYNAGAPSVAQEETH